MNTRFQFTSETAAVEPNERVYFHVIQKFCTLYIKWPLKKWGIILEKEIVLLLDSDT